MLISEVEQIIELERSLHLFSVRQNKKRRRKLLHPEFYEIGRSGKSYNYDEINAMMDAEQQSKGRVHSQEYDVIALTPSIYQLIYKSAWIDEAGVASFHSKRSSIWIKHKKQWQLKYHHGTPCQSFELKE
jgi:hypothetical protein